MDAATATRRLGVILLKLRVEELKDNRHRYYLHSKSRKLGYKLITKKKTFYVPYENESYPKCVEELRSKYGYSIQSQI